MEVSPYDALCIKQEPEETVLEYWERLNAAINQSRQAAGDNAWPDFLVRDVFIRNLQSSRFRQAMKYHEPASAAEALSMALEWEQCERFCYPTVMEDEATPANPRVAVIKELEAAGVPRDLAHEVADLVEEVQYCMFLTEDDNEKLYEQKIAELEALMSQNPLLKERQERMLLSLEWCRFRFGPFQLRTAGSLLQIPLKTPKWMLKLNDKLPNNIVLPASM